MTPVPRVLWAIKGLGPGGAERLLAMAAAARDPSLVDIEVAFLLPWKDHLVPSLEAAGVTVHCLGARGPKDLRWVPRLRRLLASGRFDIVHAHSPVVATAARLAARSLRRRHRPVTMVTEHNAWSTFAPPTRLLNGLTAPLDAAVIAVSDETRASMWWPGVRRRAEVLVHGVDLAAIRAHSPDRDAVRKELGIEPGEIVVMTVANYLAQKAYPDLFAAARTVVDACPAVRFVAVGQGPLEREIHAAHAAAGLGDRFQLLGFRPDAVRILAGGDLFVLASHYEGYPVAMMEALAHGLPVVATAVGGLVQAIRDGVEGRLVPPRRPDLLARAVTEVVADPRRRAAMGNAAYERSELFDIARATRRLEDIYLTIAARGATREQQLGDPGGRTGEGDDADGDQHD